MFDMRENEVCQVLCTVKAIFPDCYGYTDPNTFEAELQTYLIFRNREESFDKAKYVVSIKYSMFGRKI